MAFYGCLGGSGFLVSCCLFFSGFLGVRAGFRNLFLCCAFRVPFCLWVLGAVLSFFWSGFLGAFLFVFSLLFGVFSVPFCLWVLDCNFFEMPSGPRWPSLLFRHCVIEHSVNDSWSRSMVIESSLALIYLFAIIFGAYRNRCISCSLFCHGDSVSQGRLFNYGQYHSKRRRACLHLLPPWHIVYFTIFFI